MFKYVPIIFLSIIFGFAVNATSIGEVLPFPFVCLNQEIIEKQIDSVYETKNLDEANRQLKLHVANKECVIFPTMIEAKIDVIGKTRESVSIIGNEGKTITGKFSSVGIRGGNGVLYWTVDFEIFE